MTSTRLCGGKRNKYRFTPVRIRHLLEMVRLRRPLASSSGACLARRDYSLVWCNANAKAVAVRLLAMPSPRSRRRGDPRSLATLNGREPVLNRHELGELDLPSFQHSRPFSALRLTNQSPSHRHQEHPPSRTDARRIGRGGYHLQPGLLPF
jgi:hypothetical protein